MDLQLRVAQAFAADGPIASTVMAYQPRAGQLEMAAAVAATLQDGGVLVVEAGTGVGKTYAYLVGALLSGQRVLVSTATKALQDQLFGRDIPRLLTALGLALRVAMLKGRSSYLCIHRLAHARQDIRLNDERALAQLAKVESWSLHTRSGDLAELDSLEDNSPLIPWVTSTRENCLGARCPNAQDCHVNQARRLAMGADLVVVNHHLFFADLNVRESGVAELLPSVRTVVFDESHQLNDVGVQFLGQQFSTGQITSFASDLARITLEQARGLADWASLCVGLEQVVQAGKHWFAQAGLSGRLDWSALDSAGASQPAWDSMHSRWYAALAACREALLPVEPLSPELGMLHERVSDLMLSLSRFGQAGAPGTVRWLEVGSQVRLQESPLDISMAMQQRVLPPADQGPGSKSWIFTSATLGHDAQLSWFVRTCGLHQARVLQVRSPFDYATQAGLYVPPDFPAPAESGHSRAVAALALQGSVALGGRTLVLTTTLRAMRDIGLAMRQNMPADAALEILIQGERPKRELLERFVGRTTGAGAVLVASASFWEGIDIPGDALQMLVIDKLPFSPPDDPVLQARARDMESQGSSAFKGLYLPHAAVALKQGAGRLIRSEADRGILVVCDVRLVRMGYGRSLLKALPPMRRLHTLDDYLSALADLTRPSTTDPS